LFICRLNAFLLSAPSFLTQFQIQNKYFATLLLFVLPFWRFARIQAQGGGEKNFISRHFFAIAARK
jgi:hypothetical protein